MQIESNKQGGNYAKKNIYNYSYFYTIYILQSKCYYKYRFYQEEKVGEYLTPKDKSNYSYIDYENKKYGEYGPYLDECNDTNKDVLNTYLYPYKTLKGINYVKVYNLSRKININKVKIFDQNLESEYQIIETHQYINNYLDTGGYILIKLNSQIPYTNFNITISSTDYSKIISYKLFNTIENHLIDKTVLTLLYKKNLYCTMDSG